MSARDTPKQVRTRASETRTGRPRVSPPPAAAKHGEQGRGQPPAQGVQVLASNGSAANSSAASINASPPFAPPRHRRHRRHGGHCLPRRLQCRPPGHRHRCFEPPPFIRAAPLESNLQEWHYVLQGPPDSPYSGGLQHSTRSKVPWLAAAHAQSATAPEAAPAQGRPLRPNGKPLAASVTTESRGVRWRPAPASRRAEQRRRSLGRYHGKIVFPNEYPFKPPSIFMLTPNGRFETGRRSRSP